MKKSVTAALFLTLFTPMSRTVAQDHADVPDAVAGCVQCHHEEGLPGLPGYPRLAGMDKSAIIEILKGHRDSQVPDSTMDKIAAGLDDDQIEAAAEYFSGLAPSDPPPFDLGE